MIVYVLDMFSHFEVVPQNFCSSNKNPGHGVTIAIHFVEGC